MFLCVVGSASHDNFAKVRDILTRDRLELRQKRFADDGDDRARIVEDVRIVVRLGLRVYGNGDRAEFDRAEKGVQEFGRVEQKEKDAFGGANAKSAKGVAGAVCAIEELLIGDALFAALDGDIVRTAFEDVAIHEIGGDVEERWYRYHVAAACAAHVF